MGETEADWGSDLPPSSLPELSDDFPDGADGGERGSGSEDVGDDRDPAAAWFRADAIERGYFAADAVGDPARRGLSRYYREAGLMSERAYRRISRYEVTAEYADHGEEDVERDCGF